MRTETPVITLAEEIKWFLDWLTTFFAFQVSILSPAWSRRIFGVIGGIAFVFSSYAFFLFDIGYEKTIYKVRKVNLLALFVFHFLVGFFITQLSVECHVRGWISGKNEKMSAADEIRKKHEEWKTGLSKIRTLVFFCLIYYKNKADWTSTLFSKKLRKSK